MTLAERLMRRFMPLPEVLEPPRPAKPETEVLVDNRPQQPAKPGQPAEEPKAVREPARQQPGLGGLDPIVFGNVPRVRGEW